VSPTDHEATSIYGGDNTPPGHPEGLSRHPV